MITCLICGLPLISANDLVSPTKQRRVELSYTATLTIPSGAHSAKLWLPLPKSDDHQEISAMQIKSDYPFSLLNDSEYGNSVLVASADNPKTSTINVEMSFQIQRFEYVHRPTATLKASDHSESDPLMPRWLQADKLVPLNQRTRDLAAEVTKGKASELEKLRAIYDYAVNNLKYDKSGTGWGRGDIAFACDEKRGNCTDFHALIIGLCRVSNIPARFAIGFSLPTDKANGEIAGYHCWAEAYIKGFGWLPMDASEANKHPEQKEYFFGAHDENRVQFSFGRDIPIPQIHSQPLNYFIYPYGEVDDKPVEKVDRKFSFKNL